MIATAAPRILRRRRTRRLHASLADELPDLARALARATSAGHPFASSCLQAAQASPDTARDVLLDAAGRSDHGAPPAEALAVLADVAGGRSLIAAVAVHEAVGGDLPRALRALADSLAAQRRLRGEIAVATAQARFAGRIVPAVPVVTLALVALVNPVALTPLVASGPGRVILLASATLDAAALVLLRRIARAVQP